MSPSEIPWYESFFGADYLSVYGHVFSPERAEKEAAFVRRVLGLGPGDRVLDLCCGQGRHAVLLARYGLRVAAQDLSAEYLDMARQHAVSTGIELETAQSDMRQVAFKGAFDAVINMFTAFGYLESEEEDIKVLAQVQKALKPGGKLLLDTLNREWVVSNYIQNDWRTSEDGTIYLEHRELDLTTSRNHVSFTIISPDGTCRQSGGHHIRLYTLTEMIGMLKQTGLELVEVYGGFDGEPYSVDSRRMIVVAHKKQGGQ